MHPSTLPQGWVPARPSSRLRQFSVPTSELELAFVRNHIRCPSIPHLSCLAITSEHVFTLQPQKGWPLSRHHWFQKINKSLVIGRSGGMCVLVPLPVNSPHSSGPLSLLNTQAKWSWNCLSNHNYPSLFSFQVSSWSHLVLWRVWGSKAFLGSGICWSCGLTRGHFFPRSDRAWRGLKREFHLLTGSWRTWPIDSSPCHSWVLLGPWCCVWKSYHPNGIASTELISSISVLMGVGKCFQFLHPGNQEHSVLALKVPMTWDTSSCEWGEDYLKEIIHGLVGTLTKSPPCLPYLQVSSVPTPSIPARQLQARISPPPFFFL